MINGYFGKNGVMTNGWETEQDAINEFEQYYHGETDANGDLLYDNCKIIEIEHGNWVIAY